VSAGVDLDAADNPFAAADAERFAVWEMLVRRDTGFFLSGDWSIVAEDYVEAGFLGIDASRSLDPEAWRATYPDVASYRDAALAARWDPDAFAEPLGPAWLGCQSLTRLDITGDAALAHKRIDGSIARHAGGPLVLAWRSVFHLRRLGGRWRIAGFTGFLPL